MSEFDQAFGYLRSKTYFWPVLLVCIGILAVLFLNFLLDSRRRFDVATVNAGEFEISDARSWFDDWYSGGGWLIYDSESTEANYRHKPPKTARVAWKKDGVIFDRSVEVDGTIPDQVSNIFLPRLLVEIDSDCGRVRVSWKRDFDEVDAATPYKHVFRDCAIYHDRPTPPDAPAWPANW